MKSISEIRFLFIHSTDTLNGLMAIPNLIALVVPAPVVVRLIRNLEGAFSRSQNAIEVWSLLD